MTYDRSDPNDRESAERARRDLDAQGGAVLRESVDWSRYRDADADRAALELAYSREPEARGLMGVAMREYVSARGIGCDPAAAREAADSEVERRYGVIAAQRAEVQAKLRAFQRELAGGPKCPEDDGGWEL